MPLCLAFNPPRSALPVWRPCPLAASAGERLCPAHREQLDGVVLGLFHAQHNTQLKIEAAQAARLRRTRRKRQHRERVRRRRQRALARLSHQKEQQAAHA
jgi:hypothetical protein